MTTKRQTTLPTSKSECVERIKISYLHIVSEIEGLSEENSHIQELIGNISVCELIAYQIGWGKLLLLWEYSEKNGEIPAMPAKGFKRNQLGDLAQLFYQTYAHQSLSLLLKEYEEVVTEIIRMIEKLSHEELFLLKQRTWAGEKWPLVKWIQVNTIAPYTSARKKIRQWKKTRMLK